VIDPFGPARGRARPARLQQLAALALATPAQALAALLDGEPAGVDLARFDLACNLTASEAAAVHAAVPLVPVAGDDGPHALSPMHWQARCEALRAALAAWHADDPASVGPTPSDLARRMTPRPPAAVLHAALTALVQEGTVARDGLRVRLHGHRAELSAADAALLARVRALLEPAGLRPPIVGELASALGLPLPELLTFLMRAAQLGQLVRVTPNRYYLPPTVDELVRIARALASEAQDGAFEAAAFRDRTGIGRNLTVQVLEFMDREGLMRFDGVRRRPTVREAAC
jgi:selenocysteine-specific elongation factor